MKNKRILTLEKSIISLETITEKNINNELSPKLKRIIGVVDLPENFDEKLELQSVLEKKHL